MMPERLKFEVVTRDGRARRGRLYTRHGTVETPAFMPVATQASVKALSPDEVATTGARMVIMNTYHLWLRPGADIVAKLGGLHNLSKWGHTIVTDSGGFQAFSLAALCKLSEDGFAFSSHLDGSRRVLSPEESMRVQASLGSDIAMQLDVCPKAGASDLELKAAVERTTRWAERSLSSRDPVQALFGIVQGGLNVELRLNHASELARLPLDGLALGGFSVGESNQQMHRALAEIGPALDPSRPRYLMGVGTPQDLVRAVSSGIDMFDCVMPTRNARNGQAFVSVGRIVIKQARYREDPAPLEAGCQCYTCSNGFSRAYLRHLYMAKELLCHRLISIHNLHHYQCLMKCMRERISAARFADFAARYLDGGEGSDKDSSHEIEPNVGDDAQGYQSAGG
jgi:queuine tRNA-ribosyltransferase